jgi:uncharacterized protein (DUF58 family)
MRISLRGYIILFSSIYLLILPIYTLSIYLFTLGISLLLIVLWSRSYVSKLSKELDLLTAQRLIDKNRVSEGEETRVVVQIENRGRGFFPRIMVVDGAPVELPVVRGSSAAEFSLGENDSVEYEYFLRIDRLGRHDFKDLVLVASDPLRIFMISKTINQVSSVTAIPQKISLSLIDRIRSIYPGVFFRGRSLGGLYDLWGFREYSPGDDVRRIYWKGYARTGKILVREDIGETRPRALIILGLTKNSWGFGSGYNTYAEILLRLFRSLSEHILDSYGVLDALICEGEIPRVISDLSRGFRERLYSVFDHVSFGGGCGSIGVLLMSLYRINLYSYDLVIVATTPLDIIFSDPDDVVNYLRQYGVRIIFAIPLRDYDKEIGEGITKSLSEKLSSAGSLLEVIDKSFERIKGST